MTLSRLLLVCLGLVSVVVILGANSSLEPAISTATTAAGAPRSPASLAGSFLRGMTISCPMDGRIWGSRWTEEALHEVAAIGIGWAALHPYAGVRRDGSIRRWQASDFSTLERAVGHARGAGVHLFWKPHLAYWGSFEWRGEIEFGDDERAWQRFFSQYRNFIVDQARFAESAGVPLFSVGVEYEATTFREKEWRQIIAEVRQVYSGRLTYAANWDKLEAVPFWDAVDLIGVQAYFPLSDAFHPDRETLWRGWDKPLAVLAELSARYDRPVLLAEIGYDLSSEAARQPWRSASRDTPENRELRRRLIEVALERVEAAPFIHGMFWWKWMPGRSVSARDFSMRDSQAVEILRTAWQTSPHPARGSSTLTR